MRLYDMIKREFSVLIRQPILIVVLFCGPKSSQVMILVDGSNLVVGNNAYAAAAAIVQTVAAGTQIKLLQAKGIVPEHLYHCLS
jgi:hypothetical protein